MSTALFMLRAVQLGISIADLSLLSIGMVLDMHVEAMNDSVKYEKEATREDIMRMLR